MSGSAANLEELHEFVSPSKNFILFLAADTRDKNGPGLVGVAETLVRAGASYVCCWGPDCERFHDCFDEAGLFVNGESTDDRVLMTTWHADEPLEDAVWFAVNTAWPADAYESSTRAVVALSVDSREWSERIAKYLDAGAPLRADA
jgi:hypothetical protein